MKAESKMGMDYKRISPTNAGSRRNDLGVFHIAWVLLLLVSTQSYGQLTIDNSKTPEELLRTVLLGEGVEVSNVVFRGDAEQFASFKNENSNLGLESGMMMTTGRSLVASTLSPWSEGPGSEINYRRSSFDEAFVGQGGDAELADIIDQETFDAAVIEFDFIPSDKVIEFKYVFASEEYPDFNCATYNDVFAFIIEGPGLRKSNIALVPGSVTPVSINSINNGIANTDTPGWEARCESPNGSLNNQRLYIDNINGKWIEFDGMTVTLTARAEVTPCETYSIKIAIADAFDQSFDSGVFLQAKSFDSKSYMVDIETPQDTSLLIEACGPAKVILTFDESKGVDSNLDFRISGTATEGVDYADIPDIITILAGDSIVIFDIDPLDDGEMDGLESLIIEIKDNACGEYDTIMVQINDRGSFAVAQDTFYICSGVSSSLELEALITAGDSTGRWKWTPDIGLSSDSIRNPTLDVSQPMDYVVEFKQGECVQYDTIRVLTINDVEFKEDLTLDKCSSETLVVDVIEGGDTIGLRYDIYDGVDALICDDCPEVVFSNTTSDKFTVVGQNRFGCLDTVVIDITIEDQPIITNLTCTDVTHSSFGITWDISSSVDRYGIKLDGGPEEFFNVGDPIFFGGYTPGAGQMISIEMVGYPATGSGCMPTDLVSLTCQLLSCMDYDLSFDMDTISCNERPILLSTTESFTSYEWTNGIITTTDPTFSIPSSANVQLIVTDEFGCMEMISQQFYIVDSILLDLSKNDITCDDLIDGEINLDIVGGNSTTYDVNWNNGALTNALTNLSQGRYVVTVTDDIGCMALDSIDINKPEPLDLRVNLLDPQGFEFRIIEGCSNAEVTIDIGSPQIRDVDLVLRITGAATEGVDYSDIPDGLMVPAGDSIASFTIVPSKDGLTEGLEGIIIEARRSTCGIFDTLLMEINDEGALELETDTLEICLGAEMMYEVVAIIPRGETSGSFLWTPANDLSDPTIRNPIINVKGIPAVYQVRFEQDQCIQNATFNIVANNEVTLATDPAFTKCNNIDLPVQLYVDGDSIGLRYDIIDESNNLICDDCPTTVFNNMDGMDIQVIGMNGFGCTDTTKVRIDTETQIELTNLRCANETHSSFEIALDVNTSVGQYGVTVMGVERFFNPGEDLILDGFPTGAGATVDINVIAYPAIGTKCLPTVSSNLSCKLLTCDDYDIQFEQDLVSCNNQPIILSTTPKFTSYDWTSNGVTGSASTFTVTQKGDTEVEVVDEFGCKDSFKTLVNIVDAITLDFKVKDLFCSGKDDGAVELTITGGNSNMYSINWNNGETTIDIDNLSAAIYQVTITDDVDCQKIEDVEIKEPLPIDVSLEVDEPTCFGYDDGSINVVPLGGTQPFEYSLNGADRIISTTIRGLASQEHSLKIIDARGCDFDTTFVLGQPELFTIDIPESLKVDYLNRTSIIATVNNPQGDVSYAWSGPTGNELSCRDCPNPTFAALVSGNYLIQASDAAGCKSDDLIQLTVSTDRLISVPTAFSPNGDGINDVLEVFGTSGAMIKSFRVFDRIGEELFVRQDFEITNDGGEGWDGKFRGQDLNAGTFVWTAQVEYIDGVELNFSGTTVLLR